MGRKPGVNPLLSAGVALWLIYDMTSATEAPSRGVVFLQWFLLICVGVGLVGSLMQYAAKK